MKIKRCLYCYQPLEEQGTDFHKRCSKKMFGTSVVPALEYSKSQMEQLAKEIVIRSVAVTGVQSKLSLTIEAEPDHTKNKRFTIGGLWGGYILKPPSDEFPHLPENEDITMHLADVFGIATAEHALIRLASGELAYITKRFDRNNGEKLAMEDMCQLTETLTDDKYRGSMEKIGKHIEKYSAQPGLDKLSFFEMTVFSFLSGNADMHLKNFALLTTKENIVQLSPAYDMVNTKLAMPADAEEMALTLNAKKRKLNRNDFDRLGIGLGIPEKVLQQTYHKFSRQMSNAMDMIRISFLKAADKKAYIQLMLERGKRIGIH